MVLLIRGSSLKLSSYFYSIVMFCLNLVTNMLTHREIQNMDDKHLPIMIMTPTPIPRTSAKIIYHDLNFLFLKISFRKKIY